MLKNAPLIKMAGIALLALAMQTSAHALDAGALSIHGYGHQDYFQSSANTYLNADSHGDWSQNLVSILFTAPVDEQTKIWVQLQSDSGITRLDWAYVDYQFSSDLAVRGGQIKLPFGMYNEIIDTQFLQLSTLPPTLYQDAPEMKDQEFRGASAYYKLDAGAGRLIWDVYGGQAEDPDKVGVYKFGRLIGGRVTYRTPVEGLSLMASIFSSAVENVSNPDFTLGAITRKRTSALSVDYTAHNWDVKSEAAQNTLFGIVGSIAYLQAGYTFGEKWTPYLRYDYVTTDKTRKSAPSYYQKTTTIGLNCKINSSVSVRLEDNIIRGYALPVKSNEILPGAGAKDWNMLGASVNFIF